MELNLKRLFTLPAIITVALVTQIPLLFTVYYSLFRWIIVRPDLPRKFVGIEHYYELLTKGEFWLVFQNTLVLTGLSLTMCLTLGMGLALLLYRSFPGVGIIRTLLIAPFFVMDSVIGVFWRNVILQPSFGLLHHGLDMIGLPTPDLLAQYPLLVIVLLIVWKWTPFFMLILTAGLQSIPLDVIEAAIVDGATALHRVFYIILPMTTKYVIISLMLGLIFILKTFGLIFTTTLGGPGSASTNFPYYVYKIAFLGWNVGESSALAIIVVLISLAIIIILFKTLRNAIMEGSS